MTTTGNRHKFILFVVGKGPNSQLAESNLRHICAEYLLSLIHISEPTRPY